jgi:tripartite-type tricarboxylate transporter receptor subunit TctC
MRGRTSNSRIGIASTLGIRKRARICRSIWVAALHLMALGAAPVAQADPIDFYRGKTIEILVGFSAGGGYDAYARALARSMSDHLPGNPQIVVKNMTGAGSLRLARYLREAAPRDGLSFGTIDNGLLITPLLKDNMQFDASKLSWVGSITRGLQVCGIWHTSPAKTIDDLRRIDTVFGATGRDDIRYASTDVVRKVTGTKIKIVQGYPGTTDIRVAIEKRELDGVCDSWQSLKATRPDWISDKKLNFFVQLAPGKDSDLPTVPTLTEIARDPTELEALKLIFSPSEASRPFGAPPEIPADRLEALRRAFDATMKDPEFIAFTSRAKLDVDPTTGEEIDGYLKKAYASPATVIDLARKLVE